MKIEFKVPILYTLRRYKERHESNWNASVTGFFSSMLRDYIWLPVYAILVTEGPNLFQIEGFLLHLLAFSIAYEAGYIYTDNISIKNENPKIRKKVYKHPVPDKEVYIAILIRMVATGIMLFFMQPWLSVEIVALYASVFLIYYIYGNLREEYRVPLFLILRFLKGFVPSAFLLLTLDRVSIILVVLLLLATAFFFTIEYASRKMDTTYINIQLMRYVWLRYLIIFFFLAPYIFLDHLPLRDFSLVFTVYVGIHVTMIVLSLARKLLVEVKLAVLKEA